MTIPFFENDLNAGRNLNIVIVHAAGCRFPCNDENSSSKQVITEYIMHWVQSNRRDTVECARKEEDKVEGNYIPSATVIPWRWQLPRNISLSASPSFSLFGLQIHVKSFNRMNL